MRAVVIDERGVEFEATIDGGTWSADVEPHELLVRFLDVDGALVAQPLPSGPRTRIEDAPEPCPVCGAAAWVEVAGAICCECCGWALLRPSPPELEGSPVAVSVAERTQAERAAAAFPVYARAGAPIRISGWSRDPRGAVTSVHVDQDELLGEWVTVETTLLIERSWTLQERLATQIEVDEDADDRSEAARQVLWRHHERGARRIAANRPIEERELTIDGERRRFEFVASGSTWIATREHGDVRVTVSGLRGAQPGSVALSPIADLEQPAKGTLADQEVARRRETGELPSRAQVITWIEELGLSAHRDTILDSIAPGYDRVVAEPSMG